MSKYFGYLWLNIFKKKTSWITTLVYLIFLFLIFIVVPLIIKTDPISIWKDDSFNIKMFSIVLISLIAGAIVIIVFKEPVEDGSELIIATKPIEKYKIILSKFLIYISFSLILTIMGMIIFCFVLCWPKKSLENPLGVDYYEFKTYLGSFFIANLIISIFFGSIGMIFNLIGNKITVFIGTVAVAIIFQLISLVIQVYGPGVSNYLQRNENVNLIDLRFANANENDKETTAAVYALPLLDKTTYQWYQLGNKNSGSLAANYLDIGHQFSRLFKILDNSIDQTSEFGFSEHINYQILEDGSISNQASPIYGKIPFMVPRIEYESNMQVVSWHVLSTNNMLYTYFDGYGYSSNDVGYLENKSDFLQKSKGYSQSDLEITDESIVGNIKNVYEEIMREVENGVINPDSDNFDQIWFLNKMPEIIASNLEYFDLKNSKSDFNVNLACLRVNYEFNKFAIRDIESYFLTNNGIFDWNKFNDQTVINVYNNSSNDTKSQRMQAILKSYKLFFGFDSLYYENGYSWDANKQAFLPNEKSEWHFLLNDNEVLLSDSITNLYAYKISEFVSPIGLAIFWSIFSISLFVICLICYLKIDIK